MKRLCVLLCVLFGCSGCFTDSDRAQWRDAWRDLRGDNQNMRNDFGGSSGTISDDSMRNSH